jgi:hypothetical protein
MIIFSDLHMRPESEDITFAVLEYLIQAEATTGHAVACLGDFLHVRYQIPVYLLNRIRNTLKRFKQFFLLPGNHDQIDISGQHALEVFQDLPNVTVFTEPTWHPTTGCWLPYRKHVQDITSWIAANPRPAGFPDVAYLHHGIVGAAMNNGMVAGDMDGVPPSALPFQRVYCGHWHRHQVVNQCVYAGSPWQTRADEAGQVKGVLIAGNVGGIPPQPLSGIEWAFLAVDVGKRFHKVTGFTPAEIGAIRVGDTVKVPAGTSPKMVAALVALGAEVFAEAAAPTQTGPRLGVSSNAPLRVQAEKYVGTQAIPEGLDIAALMAIYDEVANG